MKFTQLCYLPIWYLKNVIFRKHGPLQTVLFVTDYCNLKCKHCFEMGHQCKEMKSIDKIREELIYAHSMGSRFLDLEGGEPTIYRYTDENGRTYDINDVIALAKECGFNSVTITTNAQMSFEWVKADFVWVSLDGFREYHDAVRGEGAFAKLEENVRRYHELAKDEKGRPRRLGANIAVNNINKDSVRDTLMYVKDSPYLDSIAVNFHTPYPGTEELMLSMEDRCRIIDEVIELKKTGCPVQNSVSGLKIMKHRGFKKNCWISNFIITDGTRFRACPGETLGICDDCGFCMAGEMYAVMHLKPDTLIAGMKLRL